MRHNPPILCRLRMSISLMPGIKIIKDINFYLFPKSLSFRTDLNRYYNELKTRNINNPHLRIHNPPSERISNGQGCSISNTTSTAAQGRFYLNEPRQDWWTTRRVDKVRYSNQYELWRDSVMTNIWSLGRTTTYNHFINVTYNLLSTSFRCFMGKCKCEIRCGLHVACRSSLSRYNENQPRKFD